MLENNLWVLWTGIGWMWYHVAKRLPEFKKQFAQDFSGKVEILFRKYFEKIFHIVLTLFVKQWVLSF